MARQANFTLDRCAWMNTPEVQKIFSILGAPKVDVRCVGGCVRNAVLGQDIGDIDIGTPEPPEKVVRRLEEVGVKVIPTGLDHGTVTAVIDGVPFEITTLRRDTACDGRHAEVEFTTDWHEDSNRRDFTMNAMSVRLDGIVFDDHGGRADALAGRLRFVGAPDDRIKEDYLRILRLFRFYAWYGRGDLDEHILRACETHASGLGDLSAERVHQEIKKLLSAPNPAPAVRAMRDCGVTQVILRDANNVDALATLITLEKEAPTFAPDWLRRLAVLSSPSGAESLATRLKFSNTEQKRLRALTSDEPAFSNPMSDVDLNRILYRLGATLVVDRALISWAKHATAGQENTALWNWVLEKAKGWIPRPLPVTGDDILAMGISPGPAVGKCLQEIEERWIEGDFELSRDDLLRALRETQSPK